MKTPHSLRRAMVIALMSISLSSFGVTVNLTGTSGSVWMDYDNYENNLDVTYYINSNTYQPVTIWYNHDAECVCDYMIVYQINQDGTETELAYLDCGESGSVTTTVPNGKAKVCIYTDGSCCYAEGYDWCTGFSFSWQAVSSYSYPQTQVTSSNATITGNLGVGIINPQTRLHVNGPIRGNGAAGSLTVNTTYGNVTMGATSSTQATISTDRSYFQFNKPVYLGTGVVNSTTSTLQLKTNNVARMTIVNSTGRVGIGTETPTQALSVKGNLSLSPSGTTPNEGFKGSLMITKPSASGQYINFVRDGVMPWSIGMVYNTSNFAIGQGRTNDAEFSDPPFAISPEGCVGIGTGNPQYLLDVKGIIRATEVKIQSVDQFADFVFAKDYALPTLGEVDAFIQTNGHLPDVPSAADVKENGINLVEMQVKLLQKVEELTLYTIEQQKMIDSQARIMAQQQERLEALEMAVRK